MGFFNFLYKLSNIFTNKRRLKFFIVVGIVLLILFGCSRGVFAADPTPEQSEALTNYQLQLQYTCFTYLSNMYRQGLLNNNINALKTNLPKCQVYVNTSINSRVKFVLHLYNVNYSTDGNAFTVDGSWSIGVLPNGTISGTEFPCKLAEINGQTIGIYGTVDANQPIISTVTQERFYLPSPCCNVRSTAVNEFLELVGALPEIETTYNTSDEELQAIASAGFTSVNNNIQQQTNTLNSTLNSSTNTINNSINSGASAITNSIDSVENTLTDTTTDDSQVEFANESNNDVTSGFFTNLYTIIQNNFTANIYKVISFPIPFTNKTMTFSNDYFTNNIYMNSKYSTLVNLARSCWWFSLGYYVILDIYKKINKLKSGDLTNIENENITTDLL